MLADGRALDAFHRMVQAQGGRLTPGERLPLAPQQHTVTAQQSGWYRVRECREIGRALMELGGARREIGGPLDHTVGIRCLRQQGDRVEAGEPLFELHHQGTGVQAAQEWLFRASEVAETPSKAVQGPKTRSNRNGLA